MFLPLFEQEIHLILSENVILPKPIKDDKIHLKIGFFRKGKIIAPNKAVKLIKITEIKPNRKSLKKKKKFFVFFFKFIN